MAENASEGLCGFVIAWGGVCRAEKPCSLHGGVKCWLCGVPAVRECSWAGQFVCGVPECAKHSHYENHYRK